MRPFKDSKSSMIILKAHKIDNIERPKKWLNWGGI